MDIQNLYQLFTNCSGISTDTRKINKDDMFFALKGENFNGNKFAEDALKKGAKYAIIDEQEYKTNNNIILIGDVLQTLQNLANYHRKQLKIPILAITGTNGKTTTKELIKSVLEQKFKLKATQGNFNNHIGVPLTLLGFNTNLEFGIVEMGANHPGEIAELCKIAEPDFGLITNIGKAHIEGFGSFAGVIKTKNELYDFLKANQKLIFYNKANNLLKELVGDYKNTYTYSTDNSSNCNGKIIESNPFVKITTCDNIEIQTNLIGNYNLENIVAAYCIAKYFKVDIEKIKQALENYKPENKRSQFSKTEKNKIVIDAYNANPTSMSEAIKNLAQLDFDNKTLILGDMFELGKISELEHKKITELVDNNNFTDVYFVGKEFFKHKNNKFKFFETINDISEFLKKNELKNRFILLKASRGISLEKLLEFL